MVMGNCAATNHRNRLSQMSFVVSPSAPLSAGLLNGERPFRRLMGIGDSLFSE